MEAGEQTPHTGDNPNWRFGVVRSVRFTRKSAFGFVHIPSGRDPEHIFFFHLDEQMPLEDARRWRRSMHEWNPVGMPVYFLIDSVRVDRVQAHSMRDVFRSSHISLRDPVCHEVGLRRPSS